MIKNKKVLILALVVLILVAGGSYLVYTRYQAKTLLDTQTEQFKEERNIVINKVKALTPIPSEEPEMYTVSDAELLRSQQTFFKNAQIGDILLIFGNNNVAVLYRNSTNQIINAGPIDTATSTNQ